MLHSPFLTSVARENGLAQAWILQVGKLCPLLHTQPPAARLTASLARRLPRLPSGPPRPRAEVTDPSEDLLPRAPVVHQVACDRAGWITRVRALPVGIVALELGAGRRTKADQIDHSVGILLHRKRGDRVAKGEAIAEIHARDEASAAQAAERLLAAYEIGEEPAPSQGVVLDVIS